MTTQAGSATGFVAMNLMSPALLLGLLTLPAILLAEEPVLPKFNPTPVSNGPALMFKQPKRNSSELALYLFDPIVHEKPHLLWQDRYHPNPRELKRLSTKEVLFEFQDQLRIVDLPSGEVTPLLPGKEQNKLVAIEEKTIYFFKRLTTKTRKDLGTKLTSGKNDKTVVEKYFRPRDVLFRYDLSAEGGAKIVSPVVIEHLLEVTKEEFFVITADQPQKVARISREGKLTEICSFDSQWVAKMTTHAISPKGDYLALAVLGLEQDFHEERTLLVCDLKKNKVCYSDPDVPLGPSFFSGRSNFLDLTWRTDEILQYGSPFWQILQVVNDELEKLNQEKEKSLSRFANVKTQLRLNKEDQAKLPEVILEDEPKRKRLGQFDLEFGEVYFSGKQDPIASILDKHGVAVRDLAVDLQGRWGAFIERQDDQVYLIDGARRNKKAIHSGWAHDLKWLEVEAQKNSE